MGEKQGNPLWVRHAHNLAPFAIPCLQASLRSARRLGHAFGSRGLPLRGRRTRGRTHARPRAPIPCAPKGGSRLDLLDRAHPLRVWP